ncbi:aspartyl protease family protein [Opitutus sp. ER46]|uniref:aspartyl protease family protein n=1 Tax=Opitutus sp. ER46 TaxID=2161864 RepID=UPI00130498C1|nr:aspartyl protease family protein [Opitutus sp. ER46]
MYLPFRREPARPGRTRLGSPIVELPAQIVGNFLIVEAKWDRQGPYHFLIDTGSANTLVTPALVRRHGTGMPGPGAPRVRVASAEGDVLELPAGSLHRLELGDATFEDVPVLIHDLAELSAHLGVRIDGLLGFPLFRETRLTLDYPHHRVLLQPMATTALTPGRSVRFDDVHKTPVIHVQIGSRNVIVLLDSGSDATLSLNPHGLDAAFAFGPRRGATLGTIGGDHPQEIGRLGEELSIAEYALPNPVVDLTEDLSAVGGGILKHFTVTFDTAHDQVTFLRDSTAPIVLPARRSAGLSFSKTPAYWRVAGVIPDSPAAAANIQFGDLVTRINGESVSKWNLTRYEQLVSSTSSITFTLLFGTTEVEKTVAVFDLVP